MALFDGLGSLRERVKNDLSKTQIKLDNATQNGDAAEIENETQIMRGQLQNRINNGRNAINATQANIGAVAAEMLEKLEKNAGNKDAAEKAKTDSNTLKQQAKKVKPPKLTKKEPEPRGAGSNLKRFGSILRNTAIAIGFTTVAVGGAAALAPAAIAAPIIAIATTAAASLGIGASAAAVPAAAVAATFTIGTSSLVADKIGNIQSDQEKTNRANQQNNLQPTQAPQQQSITQAPQKGLPTQQALDPEMLKKAMAAARKVVETKPNADITKVGIEKYKELAAGGNKSRDGGRS